ncbi:hypothetical protein RB195_023155 [Necator americanus]|uniref:Adenylate kinase n=1 Tax=Necator americanus TaxID=51031 RepID=A0ABR1EKB8_NECAM
MLTLTNQFACFDESKTIVTVRKEYDFFTDDFPSARGGADVARDAVQELQKTKVDGVVSEDISSDSPKNDSSVSKPSHIPLENETIALEAPFAPYNNEVVISQIPSSSRADSRVVRKSPPPPKTATRTYTTPLANEPLLTGIPTDAPVLLVIGAPGAQKANIARYLAQKYEGFLFLSMGVLLRAKVSAESRDELWQRVERKMDQGEPVPMKLCRELLYHQLHRYGKTSWGFVIEGYPRTEAQLVDIQSVLKRIDIAILIDCTEQFCIDTLSRRFRDGSEVRPDDSPNVVKRRLALFKQNTLPMLKLLDESGLLRVVGNPFFLLHYVVNNVLHASYERYFPNLAQGRAICYLIPTANEYYESTKES